MTVTVIVSRPPTWEIVMLLSLAAVAIGVALRCLHLALKLTAPAEDCRRADVGGNTGERHPPGPGEGA